MKGYSPVEVFTNPISEALIEELKHWTVVTNDKEDTVKLTIKNSK